MVHAYTSLFLDKEEWQQECSGNLTLSYKENSLQSNFICKNISADGKKSEEMASSVIIPFYANSPEENSMT